MNNLWAQLFFFFFLLKGFFGDPFAIWFNHQGQDASVHSYVNCSIPSVALVDSIKGSQETHLAWFSTFESRSKRIIISSSHSNDNFCMWPLQKTFMTKIRSDLQTYTSYLLFLPIILDDEDQLAKFSFFLRICTMFILHVVCIFVFQSLLFDFCYGNMIALISTAFLLPLPASACYCLKRSFI